MPNHLTSKELSYLEDNLERELLMVKKFTAFAEQCEDQDLKRTCQMIADKHAGHYDILFQYLNR